MKLEVIRKGERSQVCQAPLLFVHGAWHGAWCWDEYFLDYFARLGYECIAPSLRGHGGSPGVAKMNLYRIADYVEDVVMSMLKHHPLRFMIANLSWNLHLLVNTPAKARALFYSSAVSEADVERFAHRLTNESYLAFIDMLLLDLPKRAAVKVPLKVIGGELDTIFPPADVQATAEFYNSVAKIYSDTAHNLMLEPHWKEIADDIHGWIQAAVVGW